VAESWELKAIRDRLRAPFPKEQIGRLPATSKRPALDYVGHAAVTDRLNAVVPEWSYTIDAESALEGSYWIRGTMTIGGVSRPEFGDGPDPKQALGNFIRRAAMRFGVALDLWSREELETSPAAGPASAGAGVATTAEAVTTPVAQASRGAAGDTSAGEGEVPATRPGEGQPKPSPGFPIDQAECDHKTSAGHWVKWRWLGVEPYKQLVCPKCGMLKLLAMEGTTADLGPA
jgi:hypothetical protein